jgi:K+-sensing histidine kinase KdpD
MDMASDRLARLTVDLLDTSYIDSEGMQLVYSDVLPRALLASAKIEVGTRGYDNRFETSGPDDDVTVSVDAEKIEAVLSVLLDNAAKFSPEGSPVELGFRMEKDQVVFFVVDLGRGVPEGQREKIFQRLYQVDDALHHSMPGLGLGLYIAEKIVAAHDGWIKAEAREGGGSVFSFGIPLKSNGR